jgi:hypothetical protein
MSVNSDCCVLSNRGHCNGPITRPEENIECDVSKCDLETSTMSKTKTTRAVQP